MIQRLGPGGEDGPKEVVREYDDSEEEEEEEGDENDEEDKEPEVRGGGREEGREEQGRTWEVDSWLVT